MCVRPGPTDKTVGGHVGENLATRNGIGRWKLKGGMGDLFFYVFYFERFESLGVTIAVPNIIPGSRFGTFIEWGLMRKDGVVFQ